MITSRLVGRKVGRSGHYQSHRSTNYKEVCQSGTFFSFFFHYKQGRLGFKSRYEIVIVAGRTSGFKIRIFCYSGSDSSSNNSNIKLLSGRLFVENGE